jgi:hypothetical protein
LLSVFVSQILTLRHLHTGESRRDGIFIETPRPQNAFSFFFSGGLRVPGKTIPLNAAEKERKGEENLALFYKDAIPDGIEKTAALSGRQIVRAFLLFSPQIALTFFSGGADSNQPLRSCAVLRAQMRVLRLLLEATERRYHPTLHKRDGPRIGNASAV